MNGYEIVADESEQELVILGVASSEVDQNQFREWLAGSILPLDPQFSIN
jgi:prophage maintenance system killer protein